MVLTPWSSCKLCLCLWPSDSHDLLSQKMLLPSRPRSSSFLSLSQMLSSSQLITAWLLCLLMIHLLECFLIFGQLKVIMSSPGHYFPYSNQDSNGDPLAPLFYSKNLGWRLGWSGGSHKNRICSPLFCMFSSVGSGNFQIYRRAYPWVISVPYQHKNSRKKSERLSCPRIKYRIIPYSNPINLE